jgi:hypothetical protein
VANQVWKLLLVKELSDTTRRQQLKPSKVQTTQQLCMGTLASNAHVLDLSKKGPIFKEERSPPNQIVPNEGSTVLTISLLAFQRYGSEAFNRSTAKVVVSFPSCDDFGYCTR